MQHLSRWLRPTSALPSRRVPVLRAGIVLPVVLALMASACGLATDSSPRALPSTSTTTSIPTDPGSAPAVIYFLQGEKLVPVTRELPGRTPEAVIESLLLSPTDADGEDLASAIPSATHLISAEFDGDVVDVNLSEDFGSVVGPARQQALGQIVLSLTSLTDVTDVTFRLEGEPFDVTSPQRGDVEVATDCDFQSLMADPDSEELRITTDQLTILSIRVGELHDRCGPI